MKKNIWIWNHYATNMYFDQAGRHYFLSKNLMENGYHPTIFCASTNHFSNENIEIIGEKYKIDDSNGIPFVFVKTPSYIGNSRERVFNILSFFLNLFPISKRYALESKKPDVIYASSFHPFTLIAGIFIAKKFGVPCICEVRDLWPESLVAYGGLKHNSIIAKILYQGEKWIYKKADKLIFTMEGGSQYVVDQGWNCENGGPIDLKKIYYINNGVDLSTFEYNRNNFVTKDIDLDNSAVFKVVYTGSIRLVNNVKSIIEAAHVVEKSCERKIKFLIYGDGTDKENLEKYCVVNNINNVVFKGKVEKNRVPYILSKSDLNIIHFDNNKIKKYGASLNKMFEYFASGKPTVSDCEFGYDLIKRYNCGIVVDQATSEQLARTIIQFSNMPEKEYGQYCKNAITAAQDYDFKRLTDKLIELF